MPITWIYMKNISFDFFRDIKNPKSDQDVTNMWNGMHFPSNVARDVVERIIAHPHFTNILSWREDQLYDPYKFVLNGSHIDPTCGDGSRFTHAARTIEDGQSTGQRHVRGLITGPKAQSARGQALAVTNWRQPQDRMVDSKEASEQSATPPNLDGHVSPRLGKGQLVTCRIDEHGNYVPVTPKDAVSKVPLTSTNDSLVDQRVRAIAPAFNQRAKVTNLPAPTGAPNSCTDYGDGSDYRENVSSGPSSGSTIRAASTPQLAGPKQSLSGLTNPQIRRMKSDIGLEDPFGTPAAPTIANKMTETMLQGTKTQATVDNPTISFARTISSFGSVAQKIVGHPSSASTPRPVVKTSASYSNGVVTGYTPGRGGGITLALPTLQRSETTPSRMSVHVEDVTPSTMRNVTTPNGLSIYPTPADQAPASKSDASTEKIDQLSIQYLKNLQQEAAIKRRILGLQIRQAGGSVPEYTNEMEAVHKDD